VGTSGWAADPVAALRDGVDALERAYSRGHHGRWSAARRSDLLDACLAQLWERAGPPPGTALLALGGYGRRRQLPSSDVDLLLLHDGVEADELQRVASSLFYPLWDAGLAVGQAVRTPAEAVAIAGERLDALTATLDARVLAGDDRLATQMLEAVGRIPRRDPGVFAGALRDAADARRERFGSTAHLLEPDLKEGAGGLRDVASIGWLEASVAGSLEVAGLLRARERAAIDDAEEFLVRARSALHLETGKRTDRLVLDHQPDVARMMGFSDEPGLVATDALMRAIFEHARQVDHVVGLVVDRMRAGAVTPVASPADPDAILEALAEVAERDGAPSAALLDAFDAVPIVGSVAWTARTRAAFARLLRAGTGGVRALDTLDRLGLLVRFLPAWADVRCRPQRDPFHRFTVDAHLTGAVAAMGAILASDRDAGEPGDRDPGDPVEAEARAAVTDPDAVLLGALLHDIGKVGEGNHVPIGAAVAARTVAAMGLDPAAAELVTFMVEHHLLLPDTATRRDLSEEDLILDVAATIRTPERLAALYLLAKADAEATGPAAWTTWRRTLIHELVAKVQHVLERGEMGEELAATLADRTQRLRDLLTDEADADVDAFVLRMPRRYFLSVEPQKAARQFATIAPRLGANEVRTAVGPGAGAASYELVVVAPDRPGLLSWIAGALAIGGISILSAEVFTTEDGAAIDLFEVEGAFEPEIDETRWRRFRTMLRRAIDGSSSVEAAVEEQRRRYPAPRAGTALSVRIDNDASDFSTVVEVGAPDRIGLLHDVTRVFAELKLDVHLAKVATYDGRVVDAFYVRDALGRKVIDDTQLDEIRSALTGHLEAP
jgi:[protein-PII] uridylyltransferase